MKGRMWSDFYQISAWEKKGEEYYFVVRLNPDHIVYEGHFPGQPVVPGVCMLRMIKECVSEALHMKLCYESIHTCKFISVVNPLEQKERILLFSVKDGNRLQALLQDEETVILKLKATLKEKR